MAARADRALLLRRFPYGDSSLVAHALTQRTGRVHVVAKGAYRTTSRYFGVLDLFDTLELEWDQRTGAELATLVAGSVAVRRKHVALDPGRYRAGLAILELADFAALPGQDAVSLFAACERALDALELEPIAPTLPLARFEMDYLEELGLAPSLATCAACGGRAPPLARTQPRAAFSAGAGGRLCARCAEEARASGRRVGTLPLEVLDDARTLADATTQASLERDRARLERLCDFLGRFVDYHLEARPRTQREFLSEPNRNAPPRATDDAAATDDP